MSQQEPLPYRADRPLPPRERLLWSDGTSEGQEADWWDLDHGATASDEASPIGGGVPEPLVPAPLVPEAKKNRITPTFRRIGMAPARLAPFSQKTTTASAGVKINVRPKRGSGPSALEKSAARPLERVFDALDDWAEEAGPARNAAAGATHTPPPTASSSLPAEGQEPIVDVASRVDQPETPPKTPLETPPSAPVAPQGGEEDRAVDPVATAPRVQDALSGVERVGLAALALLLMGLACGVFYWSLYQLPTSKRDWAGVSFPVAGKLVQVSRAVSYWRAPRSAGPHPERVRRGTRLIPVVELDLAGGPAAVRVRFRDHEGTLVGDPITRTVAAAGKIMVAATVGFDDRGMHAAYRTGQLEPWTVEVFEARSADASSDEFSILLDMNLSSELR